MRNGVYAHIGIENSIKKYLMNTSHGDEIIKLDIGVDGVPVAKSSTSQLWPILGNIVSSSDVFIIGIFHSYKKPVCANEYMLPFVNEMIQLQEKKINFRSRQYEVQIRSFICDAPARSFLLVKFILLFLIRTVSKYLLILLLQV